MKLRVALGWENFFFKAPYPFDLVAVEARDDTDAQVDFVARRLDHASTIVDLGCGAGRHARRLSAQGFDVIGVDAAPSPRETNFLYIRSDLSAIPLETGSVDGLYCLYSSMGYDGDIEAQLDEWARVAVQGATLVIDLANRGPVLRFAQDSFDNGAGYMVSIRFRDQRYQVNFSRLIGIAAIHAFSYPEPSVETMVATLTRSGWITQKIYGNFDDSGFTTSSPRMLLLACRR